MAWMALLVICTVAPEQNGWRPSFPAPTNTTAPAASPTYARPPANYAQPGYTQPAYPQPTYAQPTYTQPTQPLPNYTQPTYAQPTYAQPTYTQPSYTQAPLPPPQLPGSSVTPTAAKPGGSWWSQMQDALSSTSSSRSPTGAATSGAATQMRPVGGVEFPPMPPAQGEVLPPGYGSTTRPVATDILPPSTYPSNAATDPRSAGRPVSGTPATGESYPPPAGYRGRPYIAPPDMGEGSATASRGNLPGGQILPPDITAPGNGSRPTTVDPRFSSERPDANGQTGPLTDGGGRTAKSTTAGDRWWPLLLSLLGLFGSIGFNLYLGWIAWDLHGRYQDVVADLHELESQLDERVGEPETDRTSRRETRRVAALAG